MSKASSLAGSHIDVGIEELEQQEKATFQERVFHFLENPKTRLQASYHVVNLSAVTVSILLSIISTIKSIEERPGWNENIYYFEVLLMVWFYFEYIFRVWSCGHLVRYQGFIGRLRFMKTFYMLADGFVIINTTVTAALQHEKDFISVLRITRFLQIFRVLRLDRQRGDLLIMSRVVYRHRKELVTSYFVGFIILFAGTYVVYLCERFGEEGSINNMVDGLYWGMITVTSVGYGDFSPNTWPGKIFSAIFAVIGCSFFALPAGILGSGFALQVVKQKKMSRHIKVRTPAAVMIQIAWRAFAVKSKNSHLKATWEYFEGLKVDDAKVTNTSLFDSVLKRDSKEKESGLIPNGKGSPPRSKSPKMANGKSPKTNSDEEIANQPLDMESKAQLHSWIRFYIRCKFWVGVKNFKTARYPFVSVQDIMDKNLQLHHETITSLRDLKECIVGYQSAMGHMGIAVDKINTLSPLQKEEVNMNNNQNSEQNDSKPMQFTGMLNEESSFQQIADEKNLKNAMASLSPFLGSTALLDEYDEEEDKEILGKYEKYRAKDEPF